MPYAKNSPGPWRNPRRAGGRISPTTFCEAGCGTRLHEDLVQAGMRTHPTCDPHDRREDRQCPAPPA